jgi:hypothetical protein
MDVVLGRSQMIQALIIATVLLVAIIGYQAHRSSGLEDRIRALQEERAASRMLHAQATELAMQEVKQKEQELLKVQEDAITKAQAEAMAARTRANELDRIAGRLRDHITYLASSGHSSSSTTTSITGGSQATTSTSVVLAKLYGSVDQEAVELAQSLDASYLAGRTCERLYEAAVSAK